MPPLPLTSKLTPEENSLLVLPPLSTYSKLRSSPTHIKTPLPTHINGPSTSSPIYVPNPTQATANLFSVECTSLSLSLFSSDGEFRCFSDQNSSSKPIARRSLLKELNLVMSDLKPRKWKLYQRIRRKESALCKLRKKYRPRKLKDLCDVDSDPLIGKISNSLNAEALRLLAAIIRNSRHKLRRRWNFEEIVLALSLLMHSPKSYLLLQTLFPLPSGRTLQSLLNTVHFRTGMCL